MSAVQSQILFDISYNINANSDPSTRYKSKYISNTAIFSSHVNTFVDNFLLSAISNEMVNPISRNMGIDKYRSKAAAHFRTYPSLSSNQPVVAMDIENITDFLLSFDHVYNKSSKTLKWLHIYDLVCLESIVEKFGLNEIVEAAFRDVRPHCSFIETAEGFVVSTR